MPTIFHQVTNPNELNILSEKQANYENLSFEFSPNYIDKLKAMLGQKHSYQLFVNDELGNFMGYIAGAETIFPEHLFISELFVDPSAQGKGVGSASVNKAIEFAKRGNLKGVVTETEFENLPAQKLYEKCGFMKIDNSDWKEGVTYQLQFK